MKREEFFRKYANIPLPARDKPINLSKYGTKTIDDIYFRIKELNDKIRPDEIDMQNLLNITEDYFLNKDE